MNSNPGGSKPTQPVKPLLPSLLILLAWASTVPARDVFLVVGGGYSPTGNQVSLEKNVQYLQRLLEPAGAKAHIFFSDGNHPDRDLHYLGEEDSIPRANALMAEILRTDDHLWNQYRDHQIQGVQGPASRSALEEWFSKEGAALQAGDRLVLYITTHGGRSRNRKEPRNTRIHLWDNQSFDVQELAGWIHDLPQGVAVTLVMVQCHSGGFADLIFEEANPEKGLAERPISGFFATFHDRLAAGCTADVHEENYHEYSTYFWAALTGTDRFGKPHAQPDYDGNGVTSASEAHAWTVLNAATIDIPVQTSDAFLMSLSDKPPSRSTKVSLADLLEDSPSTTGVVLSELCKQLGVPHEDLVRKASEKEKDLRKAYEEARDQASETRRAHGASRNLLLKAIRYRWPELYSPQSPRVVELLTKDANLFVQTVEKLPAYANWRKQGAQLEEQEWEAFLKEKDWVRARRLVWTADVALAARNLLKSRDKRNQAAYHRLVELENRPLITTP